MVNPADACDLLDHVSDDETPAWAALDPDFAAGKRAIEAGDCTNIGLRDARNARTIGR
jgi:hypothetical protein